MRQAGAAARTWVPLYVDLACRLSAVSNSEATESGTEKSALRFNLYVAGSVVLSGMPVNSSVRVLMDGRTFHVTGVTLFGHLTSPPYLRLEVVEQV